MKKYIVYRITHLPTGMFYIGRKTGTQEDIDNYWGSSHHPLFRSKNYKKEMYKRKGETFIEDSLNDYTFEIIHESKDAESLSVDEEYYISKHFDDALNANMMINGKFSTAGHKFSDEINKKKGHHKEKHPLWGKKHKPSSKKKMSEKRKGKPNHRKGKKHTEKAIALMKIAASNRTKEHQDKLTAKRKLHAEKMKAEGNCLSSRLNDGEKYECKYCGKLSSKGNWKRWHNENCKHKDDLIE